MGTKDSDSGEGDLFIKSIVSDLIDDVDEFSDIFEHISLEEVLAHLGELNLFIKSYKFDKISISVDFY